MYCTCGQQGKGGGATGGGEKRAGDGHAPVRCGGPRAVSTKAVRTVPAGGARLATARAHADTHTLARTRHATRRRRPRHPRNRRCPHLRRRLSRPDYAMGMQPRRSDTAGGQGTPGGRRRPDGPNADVPVQWCRGLCRGRTRARENRGASPVVSHAQQHPSLQPKKLSCAQDRGRSKTLPTHGGTSGLDHAEQRHATRERQV